MFALAAARLVLAFVALTCLWFAKAGWQEGRGQHYLTRAAVAALWTAAAAVIVYGMATS
jgi:hypothetical protein